MYSKFCGTFGENASNSMKVITCKINLHKKVAWN